jgi:hypothetical protein
LKDVERKLNIDRKYDWLLMNTKRLR